jgi:septal ring-binding cell division protein DamX
MNALRLLALQRRAFVQIARDYNERIARYLDLASPGQLSASRLTGMLINTGVSSTATRSASPAPPVRRQSSNESAPPPTFAAGSPPAVQPNGDETIRDDAVKATSATESTAAHSPPRQEKSLLVSPQRSSASYP